MKSYKSKIFKGGAFKRFALVIAGMTIVNAYELSADTYTDRFGQTWTYTVGEDGKSVTLTGVGDKALAYDAANFPWTFQKDGTWYTITEVDTEACKSWGELNGVLSVPGTVVSLKASAFAGCAKLSEVKIAEGIITLGQKVFSSAVNADGGSGVVVIPSSVDELGLDFMYYGGLYTKAAWFKGKPTVSSGEQTYSSISPYRAIYCSASNLRIKTILFGRNTKLSYSNTTFLHSSANGCIVFLPDHKLHAGKWSIGGTNTKVFRYGPGKDLDLDIDEANSRIIATCATLDALKAVLDSAANFKNCFGLNTRIEVTQPLDIPDGTITADHMKYATFNSLMFAVKTQAQLDSILSVVPATVPVSIDPTNATEHLTVSTTDGRKVHVLLPESKTYRLSPRGIVISVR